MDTKHTPDPRSHLILVNPNDQDHEIRITFDPDTRKWWVRSYGVVKSQVSWEYGGVRERVEADILDAVEIEVDPDWPVTRIDMPCMRLEIDLQKKVMAILEGRAGQKSTRKTFCHNKEDTR